VNITSPPSLATSLSVLPAGPRVSLPRESSIGGVLSRDGRRNRRAEVADYGEAIVTRVPFADARRLFMAHDRGASALVGGGPGYET
jgi:hypothetical protein